MPEFPSVDDPVLRTTVPLTPDVPEFAVLNNNEPLLYFTPKPVTTEIEPPARDEDIPADNTI